MAVNRQHSKYRLIILRDDFRAIEISPYESTLFPKEPGDKDSSCEFRILEVHGLLDPDETPLYEVEDHQGADPECEDISKALAFAEGTIKWDGCINYMAESGWIHRCGLHDFESDMEAWKVLYNEAALMMRSVDCR